MGHYAAELQCDTCGRVRCTCPPAPMVWKKDWIINPGTFKVQLREEYAATQTLPMYSLILKGYVSKEEAEAEAKKNVTESLNVARERYLDLVKIAKRLE